MLDHVSPKQARWRPSFPVLFMISCRSRYSAFLKYFSAASCRPHTDEYHYMAWKAIADELHIPFNREVNNQLRGVSRMESLKLVLRNSPVRYSEREKFLLAEKKNNIYRELLQNITSKDLADGAWAVLEKLHAVHIPMAIGSSSKTLSLKMPRQVRKPPSMGAFRWLESGQQKIARTSIIRFYR